MENNFWSLNTILSLSGILIGLIGIILAVYFYLRSKRVKKPLYAKRSFNLISEKAKKFKDLKIQFKEEPINNLTVTKVAIWNAGSETINNSDVASMDKLRISTKDEFKIFDAEVLYKTDDSCQFNVTKENNDIIIGFDYIDKNQGCIVQIVHSGNRSYDVLIKGTIKGSGKIIENRIVTLDLALRNVLARILIPLIGSTKREKRLFARVLPWGMIIIGALVMSLNFIKAFDEPEKFAFLIAGGLYLGLGLGLIYKRSPVPKNLDIYYEDE